MEVELKYAFDKYKNALDSLKEGSKKAVSDLEKVLSKLAEQM